MRWLCSLLLWLALATPALAQDKGRFVEHQAVPSTNIAPPHVVVWLPPGYDSGKRRYPVVYMHDGQNLFLKERSGYNKIWAADQSALRLIESRKVAPFIIVAVDHPGKERYQQYFPTKVASAPLREGIAGFAGPLKGDAYIRFLADELKPFIDRSYRTRTEPRHTAVAGSSMGGLISLYALAERPDVFGKAAAVSTHSPLIGPDNIEKAPGLTDTIKGSWRTYLYNQLGAPQGRKLWMDHGTATLDQHYAPYQQVIDAEVKRLGWRPGKDFETRIYLGAEHEENAWAARLDDIFGWLLSDWRG
ncbi:alpha/beta hydrolase [Sphingomonas arenae]|uniref:alpha/beta hydrolase n=1 Tax=Sphingomonas arenae TaxID=2812555 RepID=UPI00196822E1|nr:alpha/beta hydrolase-fold protein [Sphingomonas arenae]